MLFVVSFSMAFLSTRQPFSIVSGESEKRPSGKTVIRRASSIDAFTPPPIQTTPYASADEEESSRPLRLRGTRDESVESQRQAPVDLTSDFGLVSSGAPSCSSLQSDEVEFTVVSQMSSNRLWMMEYHCSRWKHSFSIALYQPDGESGTTIDRVYKELEQMGCSRDNIAISIVSGYSEEEYPVNVLRNAALSKVRTSHVVYIDVDFWPSVDLHETLQHHVQLLAEDPKQTLVLPAFQLNRQCKEWRECPEKNIPMMPKDKATLLDLMVEKHQANAFDPTNAGGHGSTLYREWLDQDAQDILEIPCVKSNRYEPYLVFRYCYDLPPFQDSFTGYGKNKMTWIMQLRRSGYKFSQLGESFVVHYPHLDSKARMHWNGGSKGQQLRRKPQKSQYLDYKRGQIDKRFLEFRSWLEASIPDETVVGKCKSGSLDDDEKLWVV